MRGNRVEVVQSNADVGMVFRESGRIRRGLGRRCLGAGALNRRFLGRGYL